MSSQKKKTCKEKRRQDWENGRVRETPREGPKVPLRQTAREGTQEPVRQAAREGTPKYQNIQQPGMGPKHPDEVITLMKKNTRKKRRTGTFSAPLKKNGSIGTTWKNT